MAASSWPPQSQRREPKTSPVRHSLCTRTSTPAWAPTSPATSARCWTPPDSNATQRKSPWAVGTNASPARRTDVEFTGSTTSGGPEPDGQRLPHIDHLVVGHENVLAGVPPQGSRHHPALQISYIPQSVGDPHALLQRSEGIKRHLERKGDW